MTECERLVQSKKVPDNYFHSSQYNGFIITEERKKIWAISIDLLLQVDNICSKYGIKYFVLGGTALGAVRHNGFIPWDDDIDIGMLRSDYNKFIKIAKEELKFPYYLQTTLSDPGYYNRPFIRLRNSNTTGISSCDQYKTINNGLFIDIFPLDGFEDNLECNLFIMTSKIKSALAWNDYHYELANNKKIIRFIMKILGVIALPLNVETFYRHHEKKATLLSKKHRKFVGQMYSFFGYQSRRLIWKKEIFDSIIRVPFEYIQVPIPENYDEMLTVLFGDYMSLPPKSTWGTQHNIEIDVDTDYMSYCRKKFGVKYE